MIGAKRQGCQVRSTRAVERQAGRALAMCNDETVAKAPSGVLTGDSWRAADGRTPSAEVAKGRRWRSTVVAERRVGVVSKWRDSER